MKGSELRDLSVEELLQKEKDLIEEIFNLQFQHAAGQLENPMSVKASKRDLARVKTVLTEKQSASGLE